MPVKITNVYSDPKEGIINKTEMDTAIRNFDDSVSLTTLSPDFTAIKTESCFFSRTELLKLLGMETGDLPTNGIGGLRIYFAIHPEGQVSCEGEDYSNKLETIIFATDNDAKDLREIDDWMLIPGYNAYDINKAVPPPCCGSIKG